MESPILCTDKLSVCNLNLLITFYFVKWEITILLYILINFFHSLYNYICIVKVKLLSVSGSLRPRWTVATGSSILWILSKEKYWVDSISFSITYVYMYAILFFLISHFLLRKKWKELLFDAECAGWIPWWELRSHMPLLAKRPKHRNRSNIVKEMGETPSMSFLPSQDPGVLAQCSLGGDFSRADSWVGRQSLEQQSDGYRSVGISRSAWDRHC